MKQEYYFKDVTLLVTHFNRSQSLERLLNSFAQINCSFGDVVISDDGSKPEHVEYINALKERFSFRLITTEKNKGLGNNINKGQDAVKTPYTLYVQEDFEPALDFGSHFANACTIMQERQDVDMVRFYAYFKYPYLKSYKSGFSEMVFKLWKPGYKKFYSYSDHPHLRRSNFLEKFGRYTEGVKGDVTEYRMMMSFLQKKGKSFFYEDYRNLFYQKNTNDEPSTMKRSHWSESNNVFIYVARECYRHSKFNIDYLFKRFTL